MTQAETTARILDSKPYVRIDEHGVYRVGNTRCMFDGVVYGHLQGESPEHIQQGYPNITLEEVYGCIAYYLGHKEEVDAYLKRQKELFDAFRRECDKNPSPVVQRLRALKAEMAKKS